MDKAGLGDGSDTFSYRALRPLLPLLLCAIASTGCRSSSLCSQHNSVFTPVRYSAYRPAAETTYDSSPSLALAEHHLRSGAKDEDQGADTCVDHYYHAALYSWRLMESSPPPSAPLQNPDDFNAPLAASGTDSYQTAWQIYQHSLNRLMATACLYGRIDPRAHLLVSDENGRHAVPIAYYGFPWKADDFSRVSCAEDFHNRDIERNHHFSGLGTALVAVRQARGNEPFCPPRQHFPVTAVLRPVNDSRSPIDGRATTKAVLEFHNPYLFDSLHVASFTVGMDRDLTAPFASLLRDTPRKFTEGFIDPYDADVQPKLFIMEPYQRGKIPVVFIHGLWSDPVTWVDAVNDLRAQRDIYARYQFWFFRYPTGRGLLDSAATLRESLAFARDVFDPMHQDAALDQIVLVGHSMGGLVSQLQITHSYDTLWRQVARQPVEMVRAAPPMRARLQRDLFFEPSPSVKRVVFIGTPHHGSTKTRQLIGRLASDLVHLSRPDKAHYRQLMDDNRDIFIDTLWDSWPTSIDFLEPSNPLLRGLALMPINPCVRMHSIIGTGGSGLDREPGDGLVTVSSAKQARVCSELLVPVRHEKLHRDQSSVNELLRILRQHAQEAASP